jgi:acetyl-CoA acyltransferase
MSRVPLSSMPYDDLHPRLSEKYDLADLEMGATAEKVADVYDVSRAAQDEYALRSQRRAAEATDSGRFDDELVPVDTDDGLVAADEGIRRDTSLEGLSNLSPAFADDGTVTAGNASQISDGAALVLVTSESFAADYGLDVLARIGTNHVAGVDPTVMGIGPVPATRGLLDRAGTDIDDYGLVEINEAFASQTVYARRELGIAPEKLNVNGGAIAIGHPLGASGARLPVTLVHEMNRRNVDRGLAALCVGFGQGAAVEFER